MFVSITIAMLWSILLLIIAWCFRNYSFWRRHGIPYVKPLPLIGTLKDVMTLKRSAAVHINDIYNDPAFVDKPVVGIYMLHQPALLIREPELIKSIFIKNFQNFHNRYFNVDVKVDPFGALNLFSAKYETWSKLRPKFSPTFSSGKLKQMLPLMVEVGQNLTNYLVSKGDNFVLEVKNVSGMFTTDQISSIAFGIQTQSFENPLNEFVIQNENNMKDRPTYKMIVMMLIPRLSAFFRSELFTQKYRTFLRSCLNRVIEARKLSGEKHNDLIDTLIKLRQEAEESDIGGMEKSEKMLYDDMLLAQGSLFYLAGFETTFTSMAYTLYLLAKHPEIQKRLRAEIASVLESCEGNITYESLGSMHYLDMVMQESLRLYPVVAFLEREHNDKCPEVGKFSLKPYYDFSLPDGMPIFVSTLGLHRDPKYWPNPEVFDPERFAPEKTIPPFAYMPFGVGPHNCIGTRLGQLQSKLGILHFLKKFEVRECSQTVKEITYSSNTISLSPKEDIYLEFVKDVLWEK